MGKYSLDSDDNRRYLKESALKLLDFGRAFPSPYGSSYYLSDDGTPMKDRPRETWITSRMAHVYAIGAMMGVAGCKDLSAQAIRGLLYELKDKEHGGRYSGLTASGDPLPGKACYAHAFVILAATSALLAGVEGAKELLDDACKVFDEYFWDEKEGLTYDNWDTGFKNLSDYRGLNANMHTVEAFLAVADATGEEEYRKRAGRIIDRVALWARENNYRIPEHYNEKWEYMNDLNIDNPADPFKPYGVTPGHGIEWARLITQWALSTLGKEKAGEYIDLSQNLYERAIKDAWNVDGAKGLVYTTDLDGKPVIHDRMHWTLAEAINTSAVLYRVTANKQYSDDFSMFLEYLDDAVWDKEHGSWIHQLDKDNRPLDTVWPGKPDIYHAFQAMLIPYADVEVSIAKNFV